jgi:hypothetical protein
VAARLRGSYTRVARDSQQELEFPIREKKIAQQSRRHIDSSKSNETLCWPLSAGVDASEFLNADNQMLRRRLPKTVRPPPTSGSSGLQQI